MHSREQFLADLESRRVKEEATVECVAAIGIARFSRIRAAIGYSLGEELVEALADRVQRLFPTALTVRLAPDVIGVLLPYATAANTIAAMLAALRSELEEYVEIRGHRIYANIRAGYATTTSEAAAGVDIVNRAELALDQARENGLSLQKFSEEEYGNPADRLALLDEMRHGLDGGEVSLFYQPQVCTRTGKVASVESLMRWTSQRRGVVSPSQFIAAAEETGQIRYLTEFAIRQALEDSRNLEREGFPMRIGVNISSRLLTDRGFVEHALRLLDGASDRITFEITETAVVDDWKIALENLNLFSVAGVRLAIDDYGSGLSSLAYVQQLPIHELKIDRSFITQLTTTHRDPLLVRSTIELGHALDLEVVGEGVEDAETLALLSVMGCDLAQGYFVGRPMPLPKLVDYLRAGTAQELVARPFAVSFMGAR
jgi:EAL domain-containing protein (putative c-di-GMP-specific phosphodiesterase class I)/GGDEF domain-containing protein